jgi:hypothetical protein
MFQDTLQFNYVDDQKEVRDGVVGLGAALLYNHWRQEICGWLIQ